MLLSSLILGIAVGALLIWVVGPYLRYRILATLLRRGLYLNRDDDSTAAPSSDNLRLITDNRDLDVSDTEKHRRRA